ncbi:hypothetical protein F0562_011120 [Nyssa sinensis]|uniref:Endoplasmic reticulum transmembrane protein n=1 Tax=Nyssa sinensis TaxID=561372 RepID=A0A5J5A5T0_9ASTE|nr:hypothetical protein F0562_011120 [Nyssa sinensis]
MIQLLFTVILVEFTMLLILFFETPVREFAMTALDGAKQSRGPVMVKTVEGAVLLWMISSFYRILKIRFRSVDVGSMNPMDQIITADRMLEASLAGFLLFLSMVIGRLHQIIRECSLLMKIIMVEEKQLAESKFYMVEHLNTSRKEIAILKAKIEKLEFECKTKANEAKAAEANALALKKKYEEFRLHYERLLEYNQILQSQLLTIDQGFLNDNQKAGWPNLKYNIMSSGLLKFPWEIQTSNNNRGKPGSENEAQLQTTNQSNRCQFSGSRVISLPRHRRPIYQH